MTNTSSIRSEDPSISIRETTLASENYVFPGFARQKAAGCRWAIPGCSAAHHRLVRLRVLQPHSPEGPIQTNDDQIQSAVYASGLVWGGLNTTLPASSTGQIGIAYFAVSPNLTSSGLTATIAKQGYLVAPGNDVEFPSIGVDSQGKGVISFTLSGPSYYPTSAYATIDSSGAGKVKVAALGKAPQDGFTEYQFLNDPKPNQWRPRWGDYSAAVPVGRTIYFAGEYIQYANCSDKAFLKDPTCGNTRSGFANWGTALNKIDLSSSSSNSSN